MNILTSLDPSRPRWAWWQAWDNSSYEGPTPDEPGSPLGQGETEVEAVGDLLEKLLEHDGPSMDLLTAQLEHIRSMVDVLMDENRQLRKWQAAVLRVVSEQAEDEALWGAPASVVEDYLQQALRRLHSVIEGE